MWTYVETSIGWVVGFKGNGWWQAYSSHETAESAAARLREILTARR